MPVSDLQATSLVVMSSVEHFTLSLSPWDTCLYTHTHTHIHLWWTLQTNTLKSSSSSIIHISIISFTQSISNPLPQMLGALTHNLWAVLCHYKIYNYVFIKSVITRQSFPSVLLWPVLPGCVWGAIQCVTAGDFLELGLEHHLLVTLKLHEQRPCEMTTVERTGCGQLMMDFHLEMKDEQLVPVCQFMGSLMHNKFY